MNKIFKSELFAAIIISLVLVPSCKKSDSNAVDPGNPVTISTEAYQKEVIESANGFAFDLFKPMLAGAKESDDILISPFSITSALSMTLNGAAGETLDSMKKALRLEGQTLDQVNATYLKLMTEMVPVDSHVELDIANSVWVEKKFEVKQDFMTNVGNWYKAEARSIDITDPNALNTVNSWIADNTHDKITNMLDYLDPNLAMLLINAIYFKGMWRYQFKTSDTSEEPFYLTFTSSESVPMMHQTTDLQVAKDANVTIVDIPYGQGNFSMLVVLPDAGITTSDIASTLTQEKWNEWTGLLATNTQKVDLSMPKFKYGYKRLLNDDLTSLGMGIAFSDSADFSNISNQPTKINRIIHQSYIETNEEGTEAAAATVVEIVSSVAIQSWNVNIDRPFLYFIHETSTGTILFMGKVGDPAAGSKQN
jgi:serine protease inhibitor